MALLKESPDVDRHSRWSEVKKKLDGDPRYKAVESSLQREDWFREHIKALKEERKREKERDRREKAKGERSSSDKKPREEEKENKPDKDSMEVTNLCSLLNQVSRSSLK